MMIWDPIRCCQVEATPEEKVRQKWILRMIGPLGYPKGLLAVEKDLSSFSSSNRRFDLLCYTPSKDGLSPLLLVECKASDMGKIAETQVFGYNETIQSPFVCVIQGESAKTFWREGDKIASVPFLPTYIQLISKL